MSAVPVEDLIDERRIEAALAEAHIPSLMAALVHLTGDVHQPLHSATRGSDAGGNAEQVRIDGGTTSLHHAWDFNLVNDINSDPAALASALQLVVMG